MDKTWGKKFESFVNEKILDNDGEVEEGLSESSFVSKKKI
jgi:hypothetical protein